MELYKVTMHHNGEEVTYGKSYFLYNNVLFKDDLQHT